MPIEERNITKFVLFEFVNMYPQTWIQQNPWKCQQILKKHGNSHTYDLPNIQFLHDLELIYISYEKMNFSKAMVFKSRYM